MARSKKTKKSRLTSWLSGLPKPLLVALIFGLLGVTYFLVQTFAASTTVKYWGVLTKDNPTASYKVTTGSGKMTVAYSNNTADVQLHIVSSSGELVGSLKSIGKKDVSLSLDITAGTYTFQLKPPAKFNGRKGYKIQITYPLQDLTKPSAVITSPLNGKTEIKGTVDFTVDARDDNGVEKVDFYIDGKQVGTDNSSPYSVKWDTMQSTNGGHTLLARAYDAAGNVGVASGEITVNNVQSVTSRFPGDPNPKVSGKAYWGASGANLASYESATGTSVSIHRSFSSTWPGTTKMVKAIKDDHSKNRLPWVSTKTPGWGQLASGKYDGEIDQMLRDVDAAAAGKPVWLTIHHEPENDSSTTGDYTPANFRAMQKKVRDRMNAVGTKNIAFMPIFQGYSWATSKWDINDFYVSGIWDAIGFDHYAHSANLNPLRKRFYDAVAWIEAKGLPYAVGEWGNRDYGDPAQSAKEMREFWEWGFANKKDALGYSYFDSPLNSPDGTWELWGDRLDVWLDILKNDTRVQRINSL